ncbi:unnamed protein product [Linum tenue]|uniref:Pectate lyase superfamily protein domain-containing protein n=1 Tax=Linum tenue TaxID=586396 RepID=A0AAV0M098_9ROSI|nr:unnamed protein product [Linum tenue]
MSMSTPSPRFILVVVLCSVIMLLVQQASCYKYHYHAAKLRDFTARADKKLAAPPPSLAVRPPPRVGGVFYPIGYGADPTGHNDSADAIQKALNDAFEQLSEPDKELMPGVKDLGGAVIDLQGGKYKISKPITFPPAGGGDLLIKEGSFRAAEGFPSDRFLVELLFPQSEVLINKTANVSALQGTTIFYEDITFRDLLFDSGHSGGGLLVVDAARTRIVNSYFFNFTTQGILIQGGHETFIQTCFVGQVPTVGRDKNERYYSGTGIDLASNDNVITDTVIFSAQIGLLVRGQANIITGLHTYNKSWLFGGIGVLMKIDAAYNRIMDCFFDYNQVVLEDPYFVQVMGNFFFGHANVMLKSVKGGTTGLTVFNNYFVGFAGAPMIELQGKFTMVHDVLVDQNQGKFLNVQSTSAKVTVAGKGKKWVADFSKKLVFPNKIDHFQYSFAVNVWGGPRFPIHAATNVSGNVVVVESEDEVDAVVSVMVDQVNPVGEETFVFGRNGEGYNVGMHK